VLESAPEVLPMLTKVVIPILTLLLGFMLGALAFRGNRTGAEDIDKENALASQVTGLRSQFQSCQAKFERATILYDGTLAQGRRWVIPADVEPVYVGNVPGLADYTHFDPKTQTETIHLKPKHQN
jgi:hypothetical protein